MSTLSRLRRAAVVAAVWLAIAPGVRADMFRGIAAFDRGDFATALQELEPLAEAGDVEAQYYVARMHHQGHVERDPIEAAKWYRRAAEQGHARAQNNLGVLYEQGLGVELDLAEAAKWYRRAAEQGLIVAESNLAVLYEEGRGVEVDLEEAFRWCRRAAEAGHLRAQYRLALMYDEGRGVSFDAEKAATWYRRAARQGHGPSQLALAQMYEDGQGVNRNVAKASKWRRAAAGHGLVAVQDSLEAETDSTEQPDEEAPARAPTVEVGAKIGAGVADDSPTGVNPVIVPEADVPEADVPEADVPEADVPEADVPEAVAAPPDPLERVPPVSDAPAPRKPVEAVAEAPALPAALERLRARAEEGDRDAQYELARSYAAGDGVPSSRVEAGRWYLAAAERGHELAGYRVAFEYLRGYGVTEAKDLARAHFWFSVSAERGMGDAAAWRDRVAKKLNRSEREQSAKLIAAWKSSQASGD